MTIAILFMVSGYTSAEIYQPKTYAETLSLLDEFKYNITTLIFVDPSEIETNLKQKESESEDDSGFWDTLFGSVTSLFTSNEKSIGDLIQELSSQGILVQINATSPSLKQVKDMYNIQTIPYIIILKGNKIIYREVVTQKAAEKVASIRSQINEEKEELKKSQNSTQSDTKSLVISSGKASFREDNQDDQFALYNITQNKNITQENQSSVYIPLKRTVSNDTIDIKSPTTIVSNKTSSKSFQSPIENKNKTNSSYPQSNQTFTNSTNFDKSINKDMQSLNSTRSRNYTGSGAIQNKTAQNGNLDQDWRTLLKEEEEMADHIQKIYKDEQQLAQSIGSDDQEFHETEELFYQAKNAIDKSLQESEKQMKQYEMELDRLYNARRETIQAKDSLYHPWENWVGTRGGIVQQKMNGQYSPIRSPYSTTNSNQSNFHELIKDKSGVNSPVIRRGT